MSKMIKFNGKMEVTEFFGFYVKDNANREKNYLSTTSSDIGFTLFTNGRTININWFDHFLGEANVTESDIWTWIFKECQKYTHSEIYIDSSDVEDALDDPIANCIASNPQDDLAHDIDIFFADSLEKHIY